METLISVENFELGESAREMNSPRSLESCLRSGLDPSELFPKPYEKFVSKKLTKEMIDIKFDNFEKKRNEKVLVVKIERDSIIQYAERHNQMMMNIGSTMDMPMPVVQAPKESVQKESASLEMEEKRIESLKKRQEKELAKMIEREQTMINLQIKIKRSEDEDVNKKRIHEKKVSEQKIVATKKNQLRLQELAKLDAEEVVKKKEMAKKDQEFDQKMKLQSLEAERKSLKEAHLRDEERANLLEEARKKTAELIQRQIDMGEETRLKILERDLKVQTQLKEKKEQKKEEVKNEKDKAMKRIGEALERHHILHDEKKEKFHEKQKEATVRASEIISLEKVKLKQQGDDRDRKNKQRLGRLLDAYKSRNGHRQDIIDRRNEKNKTFDRVQADREAHQAMQKFASDLRIHDKIENVERVARMNEFYRLQTLKRIEDSENRYDNIQKSRHELLCKHKEEAKFTLTRKHEISNVMDQMRISNDFSMLDKLFANKKNHHNSTVGLPRDNTDGDEERNIHTA